MNKNLAADQAAYKAHKLYMELTEDAYIRAAEIYREFVKEKTGLELEMMMIYEDSPCEMSEIGVCYADCKEDYKLCQICGAEFV
jgi:hypothetical protein